MLYQLRYGSLLETGLDEPVYGDGAVLLSDVRLLLGGTVSHS